MRAEHAAFGSFALKHCLSLATVSVIALAAPDARAATRFDVVSTSTSFGSPLDALIVGETVTIGIRTSEGTNVFGLAASVWNYDESVLDFSSGQAVPGINHAHCFPNYPAPFDPCYPPFLQNNRQGELVESSLPGEGNRVLIFEGVGLIGTHSNPLDPGLDGVAGGGDAQFRVTFVATGLGSTTLVIGYGYPGDAEINPEYDTFSRTPVPITVVPEPGTAILLGLGLAGLVAPRRSRPAARGNA
jgi:PEP-CTERM motif